MISLNMKRNTNGEISCGHCERTNNPANSLSLYGDTQETLGNI